MDASQEPSHNPLMRGVKPTILKNAGPASLCSVFIRKICATPSGDLTFGMATGFHYRDANGQLWLITNWHVLTGRRPDDPGFLLSGAPQSPYRIEVTYPGPKVGMFLQPVTLDLYENGNPVWRQYRLDLGNDIAGIPIASLPDGAISPFVQDFSNRDTEALQPGMDVIVVGFPFEHGVDMPFPVWKRAMVASEPAYTVFGQVQTLLDMPGTPGMSGSPVYRLSSGFRVTGDQREKFQAFKQGDIGGLDLINVLDVANLAPAQVLSLIGVYAGSTGSAGLDKLSLGRMMLASMIDLLTIKGEPGENPFPPN